MTYIIILESIRECLEKWAPPPSQKTKIIEIFYDNVSVVFFTLKVLLQYKQCIYDVKCTMLFTCVNIRNLKMLINL